MEMHGPEKITPTRSTSAEGEFQPGTTVIYALHGRCTVLSVEAREMGGEKMRFYKLEPQKSSLSRSTKPEPAIWVPVDMAADRGLRAPMSSEQAEEAMKILSSREYYFQLNMPWSAVLPKLESTVRHEGGLGLAKVASFLYVLSKKQLVPPSDALKLQENVNKLLYRELVEATGQNQKALEERIAKGLRQKLLADH